ncbi:helix-turn-helix domain-containing protein [Konateibacter massiliensis]|uniref:helix-turn-helix domain-containing protein n=1 Tax=Konateibacter massiliensis TaxID=2002841 RepID=UPI000C15DEA5|nr:helix-turn-helix transcriptional regulator [Konateibacter massiliensis]
MIYDGNSDKVIDLIKHKMIDTRKKQKDIVEYTGLNKGTVSNFLKYKSTNPTIDTLKMYCDAIGCDLVIDIVERDKVQE